MLCLFSICTSNLSDFSKSPSINNFGPNLTIIFIPGSINCPDQQRARNVNNKKFGVDISMSDDTNTGAGGGDTDDTGSSFDCGEMVAPKDTEISCGESPSTFAKNSEDNKCLWHFFVSFHFTFNDSNHLTRPMKGTGDR